jgi:hypothetical protein
MNTDACQRYLEDPELHGAHLDECADCRSLFATLDDADALQHEGMAGVSLDTLPLAAWEGASHRAWPLVIGGALLLAALAIALFTMAGVSPATGFSSAVTTNVPNVGSALTTAHLVGDALQHAPAVWQIGLAVAFIAVNALFIALLRRAPRGVDG